MSFITTGSGGFNPSALLSLVNYSTDVLRNPRRVVLEFEVNALFRVIHRGEPVSRLPALHKEDSIEIEASSSPSFGIYVKYNDYYGDPRALPLDTEERRLTMLSHFKKEIAEAENQETRESLQKAHTRMSLAPKEEVAVLFSRSIEDDFFQNMHDLSTVIEESFLEDSVEAQISRLGIRFFSKNLDTRKCYETVIKWTLP